jgi:hypothetical protein
MIEPVRIGGTNCSVPHHPRRKSFPPGTIPLKSAARFCGNLETANVVVERRYFRPPSPKGRW